MSKITIMESDSMSLWYHPESKIVHHKIHRFPDEGVFPDVLTKGAECLEQNQAVKWLSDDRDNPVVRKEDGEWGDAVWAPRVIRAGFKYWAVVLPVKFIGQLQMQKFIEEYRERGVTVQAFDNLGDAMSWLESVE